MKKLQEKPLGITLTAAFCAFGGFSLTLAGYVTALTKGVRGAPQHAAVYGILCALLGLVMLAGAYGLWRMRAWAHSLAVVIVAATFPISALGLSGILSGGHVSFGAGFSAAVGLTLAGLIARYLSRGDVQQMYKRPSILHEDRFIYQ